MIAGENLDVWVEKQMARGKIRGLGTHDLLTGKIGMLAVWVVLAKRSAHVGAEEVAQGEQLLGEAVDEYLIFTAKQGGIDPFATGGSH